MKCDKQKLLIRLHPYKGWCLIVGETVALIAASLAVIPGVPDKISENAVAWAIMFGAGALVLLAMGLLHRAAFVGERPPAPASAAR